MIYKQFKVQPVAAFYRLLVKSFLYIISLALVLSAIDFILINFGFKQAIGSESIHELSELISNQSSNISDMTAQTKLMEAFMLKHPALVPLFLLSLLLGMLSIAYLLSCTQIFLKNKIMHIDSSVMSTLIPNSYFLKILTYIVLVTTVSIFASGFIVLSISANPIIGLTVSVFLCLLIFRSSLLIPGVVIGDMDFSEAIKYSLQTIQFGRAFKILVFGFIIFLMLSILVSVLVYVPSLIFRSNSAKMYLNLLVIFVQLGFVSIGLSSLFIRYGNFEEEKIAE